MQRCLLFLSFLTLALSCKRDDEGDNSADTALSLSVPFVNTEFTTGFIPFGTALSSTQDNPAYEITLSSEAAPVLAPCAGTIGWLRLNDNFPDYELQLIPVQGKAYRLYIDHIRDPRITEGSVVQAGDTLGRVGVGSRTELQVNNDNEGKAYCPSRFGTPAFNTAFDTALARGNRARLDPYASTCLKEEVVP